MRMIDNADHNQKLIWNLLDIEHVMHRLYEGRGSQKQILIILNETGMMTQSELTQRLGIQPGSASEVLGKLESSGLISRTTSETDRRTTDISLTPAGQEQADAATAMRRQRHNDMFACLTEDERERLLELLEKINADWSKRYRDAEPHGGEHHGPHKGPHNGLHKGPHNGLHKGPHNESNNEPHKGPHNGPHKGPHNESNSEPNNEPNSEPNNGRQRERFGRHM